MTPTCRTCIYFVFYFPPILKALTDCGADIDAKNEEEQTPLHLAAAAGKTK